MPKKLTSRNIEIAAEAITAAQFARLGYDVSVQYGAHQPEYDLVAGKANRFIKISVKGSQDGGWGFGQKFKEGRTYHQAIDAWCEQFDPELIFCLVQFYRADFNQMPLMYLAYPKQIAEQLHSSRGNEGGTILKTNHTWGKRALAAGTTEKIPDEWFLSESRITELLGGQSL